MPKIPTILAEGSLQATPLSPSASAVPSGFDTIAGGLMDASRATMGVAAYRADLDSRRKRADEERWEGDALHQEARHLNEWQSDPENNSKETYAQDFLNYANERTKTYEEAAPSERARKSIRQKLQSFITQRHDTALGVTERTRLNKSKESVITQTADSLSVYRNAQNVPGVDAIGEAETARQDIRARATELFKDVSPEMARKLRGYVDSEFAIAMAADDKAQALYIVDESADIAEEDKSAIRFKIDAMARSSDTAALDSTERTRRDHLSAVEAGNATDKLPLAFYSQYREPAREKAQDDFKVDVHNDTREKVRILAPMSVAAMDKELSKIRSGITTERQELVYENTRRQLVEIAKAQSSDRVAWLSTYNPEVSGIVAQMSGVQQGSGQWNKLLSARNSAILKYQGRPTYSRGLDIMSGAEFEKMMSGDVEHPEYYLNLATNDRSLMTRDEARKNSGYINAGTPEDVRIRLNEIMAQYPDQSHQNIAFNDMVELTGGEGIRPEYQLIWQNKDQWFLESAAKSIADAKSLGALTDIRRADLDKELNKNKIWLQFEQIVGAERAEEAKAFKSGIMAYANSLHVANGKSLSDSTSTAVNHLLNSTLGFTKVNGRPMVISRERDGNKPNRTDEEITNIGRNLGVALRDVPVQVADQSKFASLLSRIHPDEKNINRLQAFRDIITRSGHWRTANDGQSATLFISGDDGIPFEVHDRDGRAFRINFDELPNFYRYTGGAIMDYLKPWQGMQVPAQPEKTYPLQKREFPDHTPGQAIMNRLDALLGIYEKRTYWPTNTYMRMTEPGK